MGAGVLWRDGVLSAAVTRSVFAGARESDSLAARDRVCSPTLPLGKLHYVSTWKISDLIAELEASKVVYGDLPCEVFVDTRASGSFRPVLAIGGQDSGTLIISTVRNDYFERPVGAGDGEPPRPLGKLFSEVRSFFNNGKLRVHTERLPFADNAVSVEMPNPIIPDRPHSVYLVPAEARKLGRSLIAAANWIMKNR